jgi:crossover junction endodeoxyribonuclease RuvC
MRILGIDPGYERVGVAVLEKKNAPQEVLIFSDCIQTSKKLSHEKRLLIIGTKLSEIIKKYKPDAVAIEKLFFNVNQKTALNVAEARGVLLYSVSLDQIPVQEYTPLQIKVAITGYGRADKKQMLTMIEKLVEIKKEISTDDEYDAIACALTAYAYKGANKKFST